MSEYIERGELERTLNDTYDKLSGKSTYFYQGFAYAIETIRQKTNNADVAPVRHGRWTLEAHKEGLNCKWNVTAECSECWNDIGEIWEGFFTGIPDSLARDTALLYAKKRKLDKYCYCCGAKMEGNNV